MAGHFGCSAGLWREHPGIPAAAWVDGEALPEALFQP